MSSYDPQDRALMTKPELQISLQKALSLPDADFGYHATDLYVVARLGVYKWLLANFPHYRNITAFVSPKGTAWNGAGLICYDIPFAGNWDRPRPFARTEEG